MSCEHRPSTAMLVASMIPLCYTSGQSTIWVLLEVADDDDPTPHTYSQHSTDLSIQSSPIHNSPRTASETQSPAPTRVKRRLSIMCWTVRVFVAKSCPALLWVVRWLFLHHLHNILQTLRSCTIAVLGSVYILTVRCCLEECKQPRSPTGIESASKPSDKSRSPATHHCFSLTSQSHDLLVFARGLHGMVQRHGTRNAALHCSAQRYYRAPHGTADCIER
jgi:hypothetical protein